MGTQPQPQLDPEFRATVNHVKRQCALHGEGLSIMPGAFRAEVLRIMKGCDSDNPMGVAACRKWLAGLDDDKLSAVMAWAEIGFLSSIIHERLAKGKHLE